ncbi:PspC domain-containing protein [Microbacterium stercoris]|uniref:PspC domain-containing protein n=1 Tax=Microbacterium stercoris TaxID=2820289 RepID=A0A939QJT0_9MICO|nr:PspC domain-containing protein [Microbacterium stercoris]MBO3664218.1 PspC domain-containing protein [Microbacterium stercoris]
MTTPALIRPLHGRGIAGVCAAVANRFDMSVTLVRFLALLGLFLVGGTIPVYIALWLIIPSE